MPTIWDVPETRCLGIINDENGIPIRDQNDNILRAEVPFESDILNLREFKEAGMLDELLETIENLKKEKESEFTDDDIVDPEVTKFYLEERYRKMAMRYFELRISKGLKDAEDYFRYFRGEIQNMLKEGVICYASKEMQRRSQIRPIR